MNVLVSANARSLKSFGTKLFIFVGNHMNAKGELVNIGLLATEIEDANFRVGDTTVKTRLGVRLFR